MPLLSRQTSSTLVGNLLREDIEATAWWGTWVECAVAISRLKREGEIDEKSEDAARTRLDRLADEWVEVDPVDDLRLLAWLVSKDHPLKAADCLQLASALRWCEGNSGGAGFVCLDDQLRRAARDENFDVLPGAMAG